MACTYSTGCKLPRNHNLPQGCPRLWEWQHPKIGNIRDFDSTVRRVYELYVPNSLWTHGPNMDGTYSLGSKLPWNHNLPQGRPRLWEQGTPNLAIYAIFHSTAGGYMSSVYQISLEPTDPIWLAHTVQGPNCHKIIICNRDALVCGNEGTPNLAIYAIYNSTAGGIWALCTPLGKSSRTLFCKCQIFKLIFRDSYKNLAFSYMNFI